MRLIRWWAGIVRRHPTGLLILSFGLTILGILIAGTRLHIDADTNSLIGDDRPFMQDYRAFMAEFGDLESIHVVVDAGTPPRTSAARAAVNALVSALDDGDDLIDVHGVVTPEEQWRLATRRMSLEELSALERAGGAFEPLCSDRPTSALFEEADRLLDQVIREGLIGDEARARTQATEALFLLETLTDPRSEPNDPGPAFNLARPLAENHLRSSTGRMYFIEIMPKKDYGSLAVIEGPLERIRTVIKQVGADHPDIEIGLTGKPVLQADEMATTESDMTRASIIALTTIAILFMIVFRGVRRPLLVVLAFIAAFGWTYGLTALLVGRLNMLSMVFMLVMIGVGLDYGIHVLTRWVEARRCAPSAEAVETTMTTATPANITGAVTSAGVFLLALLTDFQGMRELGLIAGIGLLLCLTAMTLVLPALLHRTERRSPPPERARSNPAATQERSDPSRPPGTLGALGLVAAVIGAVWFAFMLPERLQYQSNLLELQADGLESVEWERRLFEDDTSSSWFAGVIVDSIGDIPPIIERAGTEQTIGPVRSVLDLVAMPSAERAELRARLVRSIPSEAVTTPRAGAPTPLQLERTAGRLQSIAALGEPGERPESIERIELIAARLLEQARCLADPDPSISAACLSAMEQARARTTAALLAMRSGASGALRAALPSAFRDRFISTAGRFLVMLQPSENVWSLEAMRPFITAIRRVDPAVTGVPITQFESMNDMTETFTTMVIGSMVLVTLMVWFDFRSFRLTLICMSTLLIGILWTLGLLMLLGIPLNLANFFAIPILIGLGCDSAVHMTHRWQRMQSSGDRRYGSTLHAVILATSTTCIGFAALFVAEHQGLRSLGGVMVVGSICCLTTTVLVLPALLLKVQVKTAGNETGQIR